MKMKGFVVDSQDSTHVRGHWENIPFTFDHHRKDLDCPPILKMNAVDVGNGMLRIVPQWVITK